MGAFMKVFEDGYWFEYSPVNVAQADFLRTCIVPNEQVQAALGLLVPRIIRHGVSFVTAGAGSGSWPVMSKSVEASLRDEYNHAAERVTWEALVYGYSLARRKPSKVLPREMVPVLEAHEFYQLGFRYVPGEGMRYKAFWRNLLPEQEVAYNIKNNDLISDALPIVVFEPLNNCGVSGGKHVGSLTSPVARVAPLVRRLYGLNQDLAYASYWLARPPYAESFDASARSSADPGSGPFFGLDDLARSHASNRAVATTAMRAAANADSQQAMREQYQRVVRSLTTRITHLQSLMGDESAALAADAQFPYASDPPYLHAFPLTAGQKLEKPPNPAIVNGLAESMNSIVKQIMIVMGISPQLVAVEKANYAANSEMAFGMQNESVQNYQSKLEPVLATMFEFVNNEHLGTINAELNSGTAATQPSAEEVITGTEEVQRQSALRKRDGIYAERANGADQKQKPPGKRKKRRAADGKGPPGHDSSASGTVVTKHSADSDDDDDDDDQPPAVAAASSSDYVPARQRPRARRLRVAARLRTTPMTNYDRLFQLMQHGVINHDTFKTHALNLVGLSQDCKSAIKLSREDFLDDDPNDTVSGKTGKKPKTHHTVSSGGHDD